MRRDPGSGPQARGTGSGIPQRPVGSGRAPAKATHSLTAQRSPQPAASLRPRGRRSPTKPPALPSTWAAFASAVFRGPRLTRKPGRCSPPARPQLATKREWVRSRIPPPASLRMCAQVKCNPMGGAPGLAVGTAHAQNRDSALRFLTCLSGQGRATVLRVRAQGQPASTLYSVQPTMPARH